MAGVIIALCLAGIAFLALFTILAHQRDLDIRKKVQRGNRQCVRELNQYLERQKANGGP